MDSTNSTNTPELTPEQEIALLVTRLAGVIQTTSDTVHEFKDLYSSISGLVSSLRGKKH